MTLAELLVVFTIMGVIAAMSIKSFNPFDKGLKYSYSNVYNSLRTAIYNARTQLPAYLSPTAQNSAEGMDGDWPTTTENFCKMLVEYINFKPCSAKEYGANVQCKYSSDNPSGNNLGAEIPLNQSANNFQIANCHGTLINIGKSSASNDVNENFNASDLDSAL